MVGARQDVSTLSAIPSDVLPRRILFHPPFNANPSPSSAALALTPLNDPPPLLNSDTAHKSQSKQLSSQKSNSYEQHLPSTPIARIGAGLSNLGNTCFLNSVLQCLTYTPALASYLQAGLHKNSCRVAGFCAMCALENHVKQALSGPGRVISPNQLVKNLRCISRSFQMWRQEDAHEYMRYLIEALQKCCPKEVSSSSINSYKSYIQKVFGGRLRSQVKCTNCSYCSNTYDPFLDLSLEIVRAESLVKALARFTAVEVLDGDNKYQCSKCKKKVRALKQFTIDHAPHVLTVQFKRFSSSGGFGGKIDKKVHFDRTLDLKPFVNGGENGDLKYSLYAVLVHSGWSTHSGHYYCFVRTATDMWHILDDSRVAQVSEKTVLDQKAYILFYTKDVKVSAKSEQHSKKMNNDSACEPKAHGNGTVIAEIKSGHHSNMSNGSNSKLKVNGNGSVIAEKNQQHKEDKDILGMEKVQGNGHIGTSAKATQNGTSTPQIDKALGSRSNGSVHCNATVSANGNVKMSQETNGTTNIIEKRITQANGTGSVSSDVKENLASQKNGHGSSGPGEKAVSLKEAVQEKSVPQTVISDNSIPVNGNKQKNKSETNGKCVESTTFKVASLGVSIPRWDEQNQGALPEPPQDETPAHCGHVLDDWDEEYDKGKRKKVKKKSGLQTVDEPEESGVQLHKKRKRMHDEHNDGVPSRESCQQNPFQAVAACKSEARVDIGHQLKKHKRKQPVFGFLKRNRFKKLGKKHQQKKK